MLSLLIIRYMEEFITLSYKLYPILFKTST